MKVSLKLKGGTPEVVENGYVTLDGHAVGLYELKGEDSILIVGYCMVPGEAVRRLSEGVYAVEY